VQIISSNARGEYALESSSLGDVTLFACNDHWSLCSLSMRTTNKIVYEPLVKSGWWLIPKIGWLSFHRLCFNTRSPIKYDIMSAHVPVIATLLLYSSIVVLSRCIDRVLWHSCGLYSAWHWLHDSMLPWPNQKRTNATDKSIRINSRWGCVENDRLARKHRSELWSNLYQNDVQIELTRALPTRTLFIQVKDQTYCQWGSHS
jgi:hypothetical protein